MSDKFVLATDIEKWFTELEESIKAQIVHTGLLASQDRESFYNLYQAAQALKARFYEDFREQVTMPNYMYDEE